ncbi:methylmalonyl Co-A mutase-associated GTPase MeaB [Flammeovirga yaeyamensis]|uniref:Methylmalonyl Co-A mutase-associated GTPase MeaB n=1 Tax=Flammeovirga yaeyamensis TaxID=367791 RepID=A0AAX1MYA3_9BACT|nr:methylmalonyl Co-A mutase-associated GTPase MeaB [Flammeovirga yaeyamensis]MBB3696211.1 LAO/AO transport system kinase [Flammeovirga yaeyamensis]NMF34894.1 methylmalonyl Co-A mutase-associated GTPase MeaB [Flammeovirga yaeyamensis]QWG00279.1 methylmalonyl Co-A mutase-associated GTPase MeaB [Flammeovirga yaeyamensis]
MKYRRRKRLSAEEYAEGIIKGDRIILSRAITLIESKLDDDILLAEEVLEKILPHTGNSLRVGITGVPGVGKSTFIESFGKHITSQEKKLAVLTIDPSSQISGGSILGDKTRMEELSNDPLAYVRPSAAGSALGGVNYKTRETMLLCEAAGFDVILIETVGVGQSETTVKGMVDFFLLLMLAGAGDELQGIKRGIMEMADAIAITKVDGDNVRRGQLARAEYQNALHLFPPSETGWSPKVMTCSSVDKEGLDDILDNIMKFEKDMKTKGYFQSNRQQQNLHWMHETIESYLKRSFYNNSAVSEKIDSLENGVIQNKVPALTGARKLIDIYKNTKN